jgi:hypothetical protein
MIAIRPPISALACALLAAGCHKNSAASGARAAHAVPPATPTTVSAGEASPPGQHAQVHDPAHPPIDCPLRKQGLDPAHLRPFEDTAQYIAFLERPDQTGPPGRNPTRWWRPWG